MPKEIHSKAWIWCWNSLLQGQESELTFNLLGYLRLLFFFKSFLCWIGVCAPSRLRLSTLAVIPVYVFPYSFSLSWQSELYWSLLNSNGSVWDETLRGALSLSPRSNYKANGPALPMGFQFNGKLDSPEHHLKAVYRCFLDRLQAYCSCIVQGSILRLLCSCYKLKFEVTFSFEMRFGWLAPAFVAAATVLSFVTVRWGHREQTL